MAGSNWLMLGVAFLAGVVLADKVKGFVSENLNVQIPSFYASYPAYEYPTTRTSLAGNVYEKDYDNANELNINHVPIN